MCSRAVAGFAGDAGVRGARIELVFCRGSGGVTAEAEARFVGRDDAAHSSGESFRDRARLAGSDVERLCGVVKADVAFVEIVAHFVEEGLPHVAGAESPNQVKRKDCGSLADCKSAFFRCGEKLIVERASLKRQVRMFAKTF